MTIRKTTKKLSSSILTFLFVAVLVFSGVFGGKVYAASPAALIGTLWDIFTSARPDSIEDIRMAICEPTRLIYENIMRDQPQSSILRTHYFLTAAGPLNLIYTWFGVSIDILPRCVPVFGPALAGICGANPVGMDVRCNAMLRMVNDWLTYGDVNNPGDVPVDYGYGGGLLGLSSALYGINQHIKPKVSVTYAWNDTVRNIPYIGKALAADPTDST